MYYLLGRGWEGQDNPNLTFSTQASKYRDTNEPCPLSPQMALYS